MNNSKLLVIFLAAAVLSVIEGGRLRRQTQDPCAVILCDSGERCARVSPSCTDSSNCITKGICVANEMYQQQYQQYQQQQPQYSQYQQQQPYPIFQPNAFQQGGHLFP
uniref:Uncharacterized protein n=1 Tax=Panagrolaimus sp. ES5 TaxID=591445 RepID=A0AC34FFM5_9BILA